MAKSFDAITDSLTPDAAQISVLRQDLKALKNDAMDLKSDVIQVGSDQARKASAAAREQLSEAKKQASATYEKSEAFVKENPGQSVAIAFLAGALVSLVFGRR